MRVLSVLQPWAALIVHGPKRVENRTWRTPYRGPLLIHAGKGRSLLRDDYGWLPCPLPDPATLAFGAIVGVCELVDCVPAETRPGDPWASGPWCWVLDRVRPLDPIPCRGQLGLFAPPPGFALPPAPSHATPGGR